jgi:hypothetical protein
MFTTFSHYLPFFTTLLKSLIDEGVEWFDEAIRKAGDFCCKKAADLST